MKQGSNALVKPEPLHGAAARPEHTAEATSYCFMVRREGGWGTRTASWCTWGGEVGKADCPMVRRVLRKAYCFVVLLGEGPRYTASWSADGGWGVRVVISSKYPKVAVIFFVFVSLTIFGGLSLCK